MTADNHDEADLIDRIGELVDDQLATGRIGEVDYDRCPNCHRHWHGLPLTEQMADMYGWGVYDESYSYEADDSPIACYGSMSDQPAPMPQEVPSLTETSGGGYGRRSTMWYTNHNNRAGYTVADIEAMRGGMRLSAGTRVRLLSSDFETIAELDGQNCLVRTWGISSEDAAPGDTVWSIRMPNIYTDSLLCFMQSGDMQEISFGFRPEPPPSLTWRDKVRATRVHLILVLIAMAEIASCRVHSVDISNNLWFRVLAYVTFGCSLGLWRPSVVRLWRRLRVRWELRHLT